MKLPREIFSDIISPDFRYASHARWFAEEAPAELGEAAAKLSAAAPPSGKAGDAGVGSHDDNGERKERPNKGANNAGTQATGARLTRTEEAVLSIIKKQRKGMGIQWKGISAQLKKKGIQLAKSTFYKHVITKLKAHYGVVNSPGAGGYFIPLTDE